jgi:hypothetical protein
MPVAVELSCDVCHARQPPWNQADGDIGPCRYCGAPLPRSYLPIPKRSSSSIDPTGITALPFPHPAETRITATQPLDYPDIREIELIKRPSWAPSRGTGLVGLDRLMWRLWFRSVLVLFLMLSLAGMGFGCGVDEGVPRGRWLCKATDYEYKAQLECLVAFSFVLTVVIGFRLLAFHDGGHPVLNMAWFAGLVFLIPLGIVVFWAAFEEGRRLGPQLKADYPIPGKSIGKTVMPQPR